MNSGRALLIFSIISDNIPLKLESKLKDIGAKSKDEGLDICIECHPYDTQNEAHELVESLHALKDEIIALDCFKIFCCVFYLEGSVRPVCYFENSVMRKICELGADFDVDIYYVGEEEEKTKQVNIEEPAKFVKISTMHEKCIQGIRNIFPQLFKKVQNEESLVKETQQS